MLIWWHRSGLTLSWVMECCLNATKPLTHWGRVTHICISDLTSIGSDNGVSPGRCQAIIRTNAGILLIRPLGTNFSEFLVEIRTFSFKNAFESVVCEKADILSRPQWVKYWLVIKGILQHLPEGSFTRDALMNLIQNMCSEITTISNMLSLEHWVVRNRYSRLLFTSEDRLCTNLRV